MRMFVFRFQSRCFHTGLRRLARVDKASLSKLRKKTGFSFMHCKNALEQFNNDLEKAEVWLREQAQKEGWARATKLQGRLMSQGLVSILRDGNSATMIEVNCETDFVGKNSKFHDLVAKLTSACHEKLVQSSQIRTEGNKEALSGILVGDGKTIADVVATEVGNIGENIAPRRAVSFTASGDVNLDAYVHLAGPQILTDNGCIMGKYGALLTYKGVSSEVDPELSLAESSQLLCQHIVGMNPKLIGEPEDELTNQNTESEQDQDQATDEEETVEKIKKPKEEESRLIFQEYLLDPSITVQDFLKKNCIDILDFVRYECGEELEDQKVDK